MPWHASTVTFFMFGSESKESGPSGNEVRAKEGRVKRTALEGDFCLQTNFLAAGRNPRADGWGSRVVRWHRSNAMVKRSRWRARASGADAKEAE